MNTNQPIALVTGANRGIGFEVCKQLAQKGMQVILAARSLDKAQSAAEELKAQGLSVDFCELDVSKDQSVENCAEWTMLRYGKLDVLVNNAGIFLDGHDSGSNTDLKTVRDTLETNTFGAIRTLRAFTPLFKNSKKARVINVSSGMGQLEEMEAGYLAYRLSKTALNAVTRIYASELKKIGVSVNSICPGWVKTDMGGAEAERELPEGAVTIVWLATLADHKLTGGFYRDREKIAW